MFLRTLMLVAVTCFGIEAPTGDEVNRWAGEGHRWCQAHINRLGAWIDDAAENVRALSSTGAPQAIEPAVPPMPNGSLAFAGATESGPTDAAFGSVVDAMVADFSASEMSTLTAEAILPAPPSADTDTVTEPIGLAEQEAAAGRIRVAVHLTGQALNAWLNVAQVHSCD